MIKFLSGAKLSAKIDTILSEPKGLHIVSYVGSGATEQLRALKQKDCTLVCNFESNGTNPEEVEALRNYLGEKCVRSFQGFHAKVYTSENGAVVCSANLSTNGLELLGEPAKNLEAGMYVSCDEEEYGRIREWCNENKGKKIGINRLSERLKAWKDSREDGKNIGQRSRRKTRNKKSKQQEISLGYVLNHPDIFSGVMFCLEKSTVRPDKDTVLASGMTVNAYMKEKSFDEWTQESELADKALVRGVFDIFENKIILKIRISGFEEENYKIRFQSHKKQKNIFMILKEYQRVRRVGLKEDDCLFFYKEKNDQWAGSRLVAEIVKLAKRSQSQNTQCWRDWLKTDTGLGLFMPIATLEKLERERSR